MIILDGKKLAENILKQVKKEIKEKKLKMKLAVVLAGKNKPSELFIKKKKEACAKAGIDFELFSFSGDISKEELKRKIICLGLNKSVSGIIIQIPLPARLRKNDQEILNAVPFEKDADILSEINLGKFYSGTLPIIPPVAGAISSLLKEYRISILGKNVVLVGAGRLVGFPLAVWFLRKNATVSVVNKFTGDISNFIKKADIIISGAGRPGLIKGSMVKKGAVVIDVGVSFKNKKIAGDVDFNSVSKKASYIAPVPGGVGPVTIAVLLRNLLELNIKRQIR